jgi:hypothetical protein
LKQRNNYIRAPDPLIRIRDTVPTSDSLLEKVVQLETKIGDFLKALRDQWLRVISSLQGSLNYTDCYTIGGFPHTFTPEAYN